MTLPLLNLFDLRHFYLLDVGVESAGGDVVHCEACDHLLVRGVRVRGGVEAHETIKVNQSQHVYIEDSDVSGAGDNAIDFVAVQYGHIVDSEIHDAGDWCAYAKGGSASIRVARNEIHHCGTGGFTAGQGTGFQFMTSPWLHYEAYEIRVHDNVVHHTEGAGLGVNGGYNVLLAHNTLYRVGSAVARARVRLRRAQLRRPAGRRGPRALRRSTSPPVAGARPSSTTATTSCASPTATSSSTTT